MSQVVKGTLPNVTAISPSPEHKCQLDQLAALNRIANALERIADAYEEEDTTEADVSRALIRNMIGD